ncbi:MAG: EipA family protein, partial [Pseudomonadota bacterium]
LGDSVAETCGPQAFAAAVDKAGADLRTVARETRPRVEERLQALSERRGWSKVDAEARFVAGYSDPESEALDTRANALWTRLDVLSEPGPEDGRCARLEELKNVGADLASLSRRKAERMIAAIDRSIASGAKGGTETARAPAATAKPQQPPVAKAPAPSPLKQAPERRVAAVPKAVPPARAPAPRPSRSGSDWQTETRADTSGAARPGQTASADPGRSVEAAPQPPFPGDASAAPEPPSPLAAPDMAPLDRKATFSSADIRRAGRGLFGTISSELAAVIEYAFSRYGEPSGYILGSEGGGALIAGLRYGSGKLVLAGGGVSQIYWQGPSVGYDIGLTGTRALFLVYRATDARQLYQRFLGLEGSAFVVGGVGLTVHKRGPIILAPIRSGLGLRLGASVGYLNFSRRARFNPF